MASKGVTLSLRRERAAAKFPHKFARWGICRAPREPANNEADPGSWTGTLSAVRQGARLAGVGHGDARFQQDLPRRKALPIVAGLVGETPAD